VISGPAGQKRDWDLFAPDAFRAPEGLYNYLAMQRRGYEHFGATEDPKIHARALNMQRNILNHLMHPRMLSRTTDSTFRQNLQLEYVNRLTNMIGECKAAQDYTTQSLALQQLRTIQGMLARKSGVNAETTAHTGHVLFAINKALETK
jgi:hypothetical protein